MITLSNDTLDTLTLDDVDAGLNVSALDLGHPTTRAVLTPRPGASGADDDTTLHGERVVSLDLQILGGDTRSRWQNLDLVKAYTRPNLRSTLTFEVPETGEQRALTVRFDSMSNPVDNGAVIEAQVIFIAPDGLIVGADGLSVEITPTTAIPGLSFPISFPLTFPAFTTTPQAADNAGTVDAPWVATIHGPCTGPTVKNNTTGELVYLEGLTVPAGEYVVIDSAAKSILANGDPDATRYAYFDFSTSTWWSLPPGVSDVAFYADTVASPSVADFAWRNTYL